MTRAVLPGLLAVWLALCWPHWEEQAATTGDAWTGLRALSWEERSAAEWAAGYRAARAIERAVPASGCVLVLSQTGPQHMSFYQARFSYHLYPRRVRFSDHTDAVAEGCGYLATFHDTPQNLAQEPFQGRWDDAQLAQRTASLSKIFSEDKVQIFRQ